MDILTNAYKRNPNEKVHSLYQGVSSFGGGANILVKKHPVEDRLQRIITPAESLARGQGGLAAVLVLGGMETSLDEMEYILQARQSKKFVPKRTNGDIAEMCRLVAERRNEQIGDARAHPVSRAPVKPKRGLFLPRGYRMVQTKEPGFKIRMKVG